MKSEVGLLPHSLSFLEADQAVENRGSTSTLEYSNVNIRACNFRIHHARITILQVARMESYIFGWLRTTIAAASWKTLLFVLD
jgi:hypothetical protein